MVEQLPNNLTQKEALAKVTQSWHTFSYWCQKFYFFLLKNILKQKVQKYLNNIFEASFILHMQTKQPFFWKMCNPLKTQLKYLTPFLFFSGLKLNLAKCEIAGIGALKGVQVAVFNMRCIDICNQAIKILVTYFLYNSRIKEECNFLKIVSSVQIVLNLWRYRNFTLEGKIVVFKSLAISKIVFQAQIVPVTTHEIKALETIQTSPPYGITLILK